MHASAGAEVVIATRCASVASKSHMKWHIYESMTDHKAKVTGF
jgi:hypothetical protein